MNVQSFIKKFIAVTVLVAFVVSFIPFPVSKTVKTVHAQSTGLDGGDAMGVGIKNFTQAAEKYARAGFSFYGVPIPNTSLDYLWKVIYKAIIEALQKQVLNWVTGGNGGQPFFETNLNRFINETRDTTGGNYLRGLKRNTGTICNYFKSDIVVGLTQYFKIPEFEEVKDSTCKAERMIGKEKVRRFLDGDFTQGGGWEAWDAITKSDENNAMGAYLTERDSVMAAINSQESIEREKLASQGQFHSKEDGEGNVQTPGTVIEDQIKHILQSDLRQLEMAKTFDDVVTVLVSMLINDVITGDDGLAGSGKKTGSANTNGKYVKGKIPSGGSSVGGPGGGVDPGDGGTGSGSKLQNVAISGDANQSSTFPTGRHDAKVAIQTPKMRDPETGVSITQEQDNPWWQVDLGSLQPIDHIDITPRIDDGYGNDLTNFYVIVSERPITGNTIPVAGAGVWRTGPITPSKPREDVTTIRDKSGNPIMGRYVRIQLQGRARLEIAGVEVFAKRVPFLMLMGDKTITVAKNSTFVDPGATARDGTTDISDDVVVTGSVNTAVVGTYTLTYSVTNSENVSSGTLTRTVIVK
jgi:hypothetical protein